ncbi:MAG: helix-turn-helix domain-containing protein [Clostridiaceae bacterium]|nr:helix-turn-helix domain-containing protein [Clostridiaceae bacterium]
MIYKTTKDFENAVLDKITFKPYKNDNCIIYRNERRPELGYFIKYSREGYYNFEIGDFTIPRDFSLSFHHNEALIRFGIVYKGTTHFEIENSPVSSFTPSSFLVNEKALKGTQNWKKGQHFHGAEITIHKRYFDEIIKPNYPNSIDSYSFTDNYTYNYLPIDISSILQNLKSMAERNLLTPLYLESKILESIALLSNELYSSPQNAFTNQLNCNEICIGTNRTISLSTSDVNAIKKAYEILTKEALTPPTIKSLSKRVFLNEQKLKAGFSAKYHMSIKQYTNTIRMTMAENLLCTTELSIDEISKQLGYNYCGNFIKSFKKFHGKTPLSYRKKKR